MYSSADWSVTPRPIYPRRRPQGPGHLHVTRPTCATASSPSSAPFRSSISGDRTPASARASGSPTRRSSVDRWHSPTLLLVYLPHLDYDLQRFGADDPRIRDERAGHRRVCGELIAHLPRARPARDRAVGIRARRTSTGPVHINRVLREAGLLAVRDELGTDALDAGASEAFAVADHQVAHVYVRESARASPTCRRCCERMPGVDLVLDRREQARLGLDHERSGELVAIAARSPGSPTTTGSTTPGARLRAHGRHPPQARLRPGRAVPRSGAVAAQAAASPPRWRGRRSASAT